MSALRDNRWDPPRMSPWWAGYLAVCLVVLLGALSARRWWAVATSGLMAVTACVQHVATRRRHRVALDAHRRRMGSSTTA